MRRSSERTYQEKGRPSRQLAPESTSGGRRSGASPGGAPSLHVVPESTSGGRRSLGAALHGTASGRAPAGSVVPRQLGPTPPQLSVLILPNLAAMSGGQVESVRRFVERGGGLVATGEASRLDEWGDPRPDFALGDLFGAHVAEPRRAGEGSRRKNSASDTAHTYLRLSPELRARVDGPQVGTGDRLTFCVFRPHAAPLLSPGTSIRTVAL